MTSNPDEYEISKEFLYPMITGIIARLRYSYQNNLIGESSYYTNMNAITQIRDHYGFMSHTEIQEELRGLTKETGAYRLYDILTLHYGYNHLNQVDRDMMELGFLDSNFSPLFYVINDKNTKEVVIKDPSPDQVMIMSNSNFMHQLCGSCIFLNTNDNTIVMFGTYVTDTIGYYCDSYAYLNEKRIEILELNEEDKIVDQPFVKEYIENMSVRNFLTMTPAVALKTMKAGQEDLKRWNAKGKDEIINDFQIEDADRKREILTLMFMRDCYMDILPTLRSFCSKSEFSILYSSLNLNVQKKMQEFLKLQTLSDIFETLIQSTRKRKRPASPGSGDKKSLRDQVTECQADDEAKEKVMQQVDIVENCRDGSTGAKAEKFVKSFLKIPFGTYKEDLIKKKRDRLKHRTYTLAKRIGADPLEKEKIKESKMVTIAEAAMKVKKFNKSGKSLLTAIKKVQADKKKLLAKVKPVLDEAIFGHDEAKKKFEQVIAQWMNGSGNGAVIGLQGPPGNGKTSMVKEGLSKCLHDSDGKNRPFVFIPLGGLRDGAGLIGHGFTYIGSMCGKIAEGLMKAKCMNPIFYFDELDKVSNTQQGQEIIGILTHLTDSTQNSEFFDEYFQGIRLDLSKALFVFTFNDAHKVDRVLRDRIQIIKTKALKIPEKITICRDYLLPKIQEDIGLDKADFSISDDLILKVIEDYTAEAGVRRLKEIMYDLVRESNRRGINGEWSYPFKVNDSILEDMLKRRYCITHDRIHDVPHVGTMNGLYANSSGLGGITRIETTKCFTKNHLELKLTGNQGDIMKESMQCSLSVAWNKLTAAERKKVEKDNFGIHVHCPSGATPKDGPSAGGAITLTLLSLLKNSPIPNDIAMTGEIDLRGNITEIGGLDEKLLGAKKAGVRTVYIPQDNEKHWKQIQEDEIVEEDDDFKVVVVKHIDEVIGDVF